VTRVIEERRLSHAGLSANDHDATIGRRDVQEAVDRGELLVAPEQLRWPVRQRRHDLQRTRR
jgi:hypothetical protein